MSGPGDNFRALEREMRRLWAEVAKRPIKVKGGGAATPLKTVSIVGGNTLVTGQAGIKFSTSPITDVPSAYDPDVTSSFILGIGRGSLFVDGVLQTNKVLIVNDGGSGSAVSFALLTGDTVVVATARTLTVGGDPNTTVTAYSPLFL